MSHPDRSHPAPSSCKLADRAPTEQAHLALGWHGSHYDDPDRYALWVFNNVLGGGMSSRLFQDVREERGLVYTVYTAPSSYQDCGSVSLYAGTAPRRLAELVDVINSVVDGLLDTGITDEEHEVAVGYLTGSMLLGLEDTASRMARLAVARPVGMRISIASTGASGRSRSRCAAVIQMVLAAQVSVVVGLFDDPDAVSLETPRSHRRRN